MLLMTNNTKIPHTTITSESTGAKQSPSIKNTNKKLREQLQQFL